ncbi:MAG: hypothetical protein K1X78_27315 [Verrucomicrobiaceae bacterium]|nr:hypothetical protein [Verrucomicrobiaceae bacterium]
MKSKKFRYLRVCGALFVTAFMGYAWYHGFVPVADGPDRARLRHALNLPLLPTGVSITAAGHESWTDYVFQAEITVPSEKITELLAGRKFGREEIVEGHQKTYAARIDGYNGFTFAEHWSWADRSGVTGHGVYGTDCDVWINSARDRAFVRYSAD